MRSSPQAITSYLHRLKQGDNAAEGPLAEAVYERMMELGQGLLSPHTNRITIQPGDLVNEVLMELVRLRTIDWQDRSHFYRVAARLLRRRLIDHIRARRAGKRPPPDARNELDERILPAVDRFEEIYAVHEGLDQLSKMDPLLAELVELVYFGGINPAAVAESRGVSLRTVRRHLDFARRWLATKIGPACPSLAENSALSNDSP
ncbi:MAG: sigma-70 family RNA polymerase sigma factor [Bryobacterales bacterium]|nr:sigma-70 family RNA polymerase sigma factor [Bryobacterales bacterium]